MKIIHLNQSDFGGGAAIAARRHVEAMRRIGIDAAMLVADKRTDRDYILPYKDLAHTRLVAESKVLTQLNRMPIRSWKPYATWSHAKWGLDIASDCRVREADVIVLHWINWSMLSLRGIRRILELGKPTVWFMHDMWPITGGCHYSFSCVGYQDSCGRCPLLNVPEPKDNDPSHTQLKHKVAEWSTFDNLKVLAPSQWLINCAKLSKVFGNMRADVCRNVIDTEVFKPINKNFARECLNLPRDKKLILFGAADVTSPYKGWEILHDALSGLSGRGVEAVVFGSSVGASIPLGIKVHSVGRLSDDSSLMLLYNACDMFVSPSLADNFPNVILEAMSCGLPCVGLPNGGVPEMIQNGITGYVAASSDAAALRESIEKMLDESDADAFGNRARQWVRNDASYDIMPQLISKFIEK